MKKLTLTEFINRSNKIHKNKYDYSITKYKNQDTKVLIICPIHGKFEQRPDHHLKGHECKLCSTKSLRNVYRFKSAPGEFINKSKKKWGNFYDYSKVNYISARKKVVIICPKHGKFLQTPDSHLKHECIKCSVEKNTINQTSTTEEFIKKSKIIHGGLFDYTKSNYIGNRTKIEIVCKEHGPFFQLPHNHLSGKGCRLCGSNSKKEKIIENVLKTNGINFIREKTFKDCINPKTKSKLRFDFYLPDHNICIEYDGIQHFKSVDFWGEKSNLIDNQFRDSVKNNFCESKKIKLIRINYKENLLRRLSSLFSKVIS